MTLIYKLDKAPGIVQTVLNDLGWAEHDEDLHEPNEWNLCWKSVR
jgi:hypothetical protein